MKKVTAPGIDLANVSREKALIAGLLSASAYPHETHNIRLLDTHISWVILTGPFAYKIKKPLRLEFLDYSTLEQRRHFCREELRLNSRWAPGLYVDVVPITGSFGKPRIEGVGEPIEYAVRMHQFPQAAQLDVQLDKDCLSEDDVLALAEMIAHRHSCVPVCTGLDSDDMRRIVQRPMLDNLEYLQAFRPREALQPLFDWTTNTLEALWSTLLSRQDKGFIRECHGDLKLSNLVRLPSGIAAYDCVEFSSELRNIDVISDISFLVMDLVSYDRADLAHVLLNRYLECSGDYAGMSLFTLYFVYHALIRAKIAAIRSVERDSDKDVEVDLEELRYYCEIATRWSVPGTPRLVLMHGFSGSGKTWLSQRLLARLPAIRLRSDIERKRMLDLPESGGTGSRVGQGVYAPLARHEVYSRLVGLAEPMLRAGYHVIVDASFLDRRDRKAFYEVAARLEAGFVIVDVRAEPTVLRQRLRERAFRAMDASEADAAVLEYQVQHADPLDSTEQRYALAVDSCDAVDVDTIIVDVLSIPLQA